VTWLVTHALGSDDEVAEELTDEELLDTVRIILQEKDAVPDGYAMLIRKSGYMEVKRPRQNIKAGGNVYAAGRNLTLIQGGLAG
jgi:signal transduction histidine kinase